MFITKVSTEEMPMTRELGMSTRSEISLDLIQNLVWVLSNNRSEIPMVPTGIPTSVRSFAPFNNSSHEI